MIEIRSLDPRSKNARELIEELDDYQFSLYPAESNHLEPIAELSKPHVQFIGAFREDILLGCGAIKFVDAEYGEIKRMFVRSEARGLGVGREILRALEKTAEREGLQLIRLETGVLQTTAIRLYERSGYRRREPFGRYSHDPWSLFMEKRLRASESAAAPPLKP